MKPPVIKLHVNGKGEPLYYTVWSSGIVVSRLVPREDGTFEIESEHVATGTNNSPGVRRKSEPLRG